MIDIAKKMVAAGNMYADDTDVDTMRDERQNGVESRNRRQGAAETARVFDEMLAGSKVCSFVVLSAFLSSSDFVIAML